MRFDWYIRHKSKIKTLSRWPQRFLSLRGVSFPPSPPQTTTVAAGADRVAVPKRAEVRPCGSRPRPPLPAERRWTRIVQAPRARLLAWLRPVHRFADAAVVTFVTRRKTAAAKFCVRVRAQTDGALALRAPRRARARSRGRFMFPTVGGGDTRSPRPPSLPARSPFQPPYLTLCFLNCVFKEQKVQIINFFILWVCFGFPI